MSQRTTKKFRRAETTHREHGFTLIELLITVAIIGILAAILLPVFARARENARRASCMNNMKQIALGVFMYTQDYDSKLPLIEVNDAANVTPTNPYGWADALQPYLKSTQIFQCPSGSSTNVDPTAVNYTDYWINRYTDSLSDSAFDSPALTVLLGEGGYTTNSYGSRFSTQGIYDDARWTTGTCWNTDQQIYLPNHRGNLHLDGSNYAFADGHVKWLKGAKNGIYQQAANVYACLPTEYGVPTMNYTSNSYGISAPPPS